MCHVCIGSEWTLDFFFKSLLNHIIWPNLLGTTKSCKVRYENVEWMMRMFVKYNYEWKASRGRGHTTISNFDESPSIWKLWINFNWSFLCWVTSQWASPLLWVWDWLVVFYYGICFPLVLVLRRVPFLCTAISKWIARTTRLSSMCCGCICKHHGVGGRTPPFVFAALGVYTY